LCVCVCACRGHVWRGEKLVGSEPVLGVFVNTKTHFSLKMAALADAPLELVRLVGRLVHCLEQTNKVEFLGGLSGTDLVSVRELASLSANDINQDRLRFGAYKQQRLITRISHELDVWDNTPPSHPGARCMSLLVVVRLVSAVFYTGADSVKSTTAAYVEPCDVQLCAKPSTQRCARCQDAFYCSREHQKHAWVSAGHKRCCQPSGTAYGFELAQYAALLDEALALEPAHAMPTIVSIGIGTGALEGRLEHLMAGRRSLSVSSPRWLGVDPDPTSHNPLYPRDGVHLAPDAPTAVELVAAHPELVGTCVLLLNWCDWNKDYDFEAIELLQPTSIVSLTTVEGHAGGPKFRAWLAALPRAVKAKTETDNASSSSSSGTWRVCTELRYEHKLSQFSRMQHALCLSTRL
jgi:hypothetical protein